MKARSAWTLDPRSYRACGQFIRPQRRLPIPYRWVRHGYSLRAAAVPHSGFGCRNGEGVGEGTYHRRLGGSSRERREWRWSEGCNDAGQDRHRAQAACSRRQAGEDSQAPPSRPIHVLPPLPRRRCPSRLRIEFREGGRQAPTLAND